MVLVFWEQSSLFRSKCMQNAIARDSMPQQEREIHILNSVRNAMEDFQRRSEVFKRGTMRIYIDDAENPEMEKEIMMRKEYTNPIIRGFYPDPSICYAEGYFYIVCSSFQFFPGLPLFRSKDMINWEPMGHCMTRTSQLDLEGMGASGGLFAPSIRYNNGRFYVVCTNVGGYGNFVVYTDDIESGNWSEPILIDRPGIDPSLLFDGEKTYFISNGDDEEGINGISVCEIDLETGKTLTKSRCISQGTGGRYLEGPHLYHIGEYYYLLVAEGGTEYGHMECLLRSREIYGPYEICPVNPILTNRNLGGYFIQGSGHADIVEDENGQWWMVHLAFRQQDQWRPFHQLGRETFLEPVFWGEDGWFKVGTDGTSRAAYVVEDGKCEAKLTAQYPKEKWELEPKTAIYVRKPDYDNYRLQGENRFALKGTEARLQSLGNVTFVGMRQKEFETDFVVTIDGKTMAEGQHAGITAYMSERDFFALDVQKKKEGYAVCCKGILGGRVLPLESVSLSESSVSLFIETKHQSYEGFVKENGRWRSLGSIEAKYLTSEVTEGFTGVLLAAYCEANEQGESGFVEFEYSKE